MKFYQIIVPVIFCFIYTTTIFGFEEIVDILDIPEDIFDLIDKFRTLENDRYLETGYVKINDHEKEGWDVRRKLCSKNLIFLICNNCLNGREEEYFLSLPDMEFIQKPRRKIIDGSCLYSYFDDSYFSNRLVKNDEEELLMVRIEEDVITDGKLGIFKCMKESAYISSMPSVLGKRYALKKKPNYMCTLEAPEELKSLGVSEDGKIIITCGKGGHVRKWELQKPLKKGFKLEDIFPNGEIMVKKFCQKRAVRVSKQVGDKPGASMNVLAKELVTKCDGTHKSEKVTSLKGGKPAIFVAKVVKNGSEDGEKTLPSVKSRKGIGPVDENFICLDENENEPTMVTYAEDSHVRKWDPNRKIMDKHVVHKAEGTTKKSCQSNAGNVSSVLEKRILSEAKKTAVPVAKSVNLRAEEITSTEGHNCGRKFKMRDTSLNGETTVPVAELVNLQLVETTSSEGKKRVVSTAKLVIYKTVQIIAITGVCYYFFKDFLSELWNKTLFNMTYRVV